MLSLRKQDVKGLSVVELAVAFFIFALVASSTLLIYSQMFGGQRAQGEKIEAALELEALGEKVRQKAKLVWPEDVSGQGALSEEMVYRVEDLGLQVDPLDGESVIELKRIRVEVDYTARTPSGREEERTISSVFLVGR